MNSLPILLAAGAAVAVVLAGSRSASAKGKTVDDGRSIDPAGYNPLAVPPGVSPPKDRGAPFAPTPVHARYWPVAERERTVNYISVGKGFQGYAAGSVFAAPRGASGSCTNGRKHAGVDLRAKYNDLLVAIGNGKIVGKQGWSGNDAKAIVVQLTNGPVVVYGAVKPNSMDEFNLDVGSTFQAGQPLCRVGRYPGGSTMLHLETYLPGSTRNARWCAGSKAPSNLLDPSLFLLNLAYRDPRTNA